MQGSNPGNHKDASLWRGHPPFQQNQTNSGRSGQPAVWLLKAAATPHLTPARNARLSSHKPLTSLSFFKIPSIKYIPNTQHPHPQPSPMERARREYRLTISDADVNVLPSPLERARVWECGTKCASQAILQIPHCERSQTARQSAFIPLSPQTHNTHTPTPLPGEGKNKTMLYSLRAWQSAFSSVIASAARQSAFIPLSTQTEKTHTLHPLPSPQMKGLERARREFRLTISVAQVIHFSPSPGERARVWRSPAEGRTARVPEAQAGSYSTNVARLPQELSEWVGFSNAQFTAYLSFNQRKSVFGVWGLRRGTLSAPCSPFPEKCQGGQLKKGRSNANTLSFYPGMSRRTMPVSTINLIKDFGGK